MSHKHAVFKKLSRDNSVGLYMGKRDFVDFCDFVEPVDGVVLVDPVLLQGKKAFVTLSCVFRYGREDQDVIGIKFRRDIYVSTYQVYPPLLDRQKATHTQMQERLLRKLGLHAYPFFFEMPDNLPCSVALQPGPTDVDKHCAVEFEVKAFAAKVQDETPHKRGSVSLSIRKVQYAPEQDGPQPSLDLTQQFVMCDKPLHLQVSLGKQTYYHGEPIEVQVNVNNHSNKNVKSIIVTVEQTATVVLYSSDRYVEQVAKLDTLDTVDAGQSLNKMYSVLPLLANNRQKKGIVLDGKLKHEDTNLASSSIVKEGVLKEILGILVSYTLVVKLAIGGLLGSSDIRVELPFQLMHPKPEPEKESDPEEDLGPVNRKGSTDETEEIASPAEP